MGKGTFLLNDDVTFTTYPNGQGKTEMSLNSLPTNEVVLFNVDFLSSLLSLILLLWNFYKSLSLFTRFKKLLFPFDKYYFLSAKGTVSKERLTKTKAAG